MRFVAFFVLLQSVACAADFAGFVDSYCIECHDSDAPERRPRSCALPR